MKIMIDDEFCTNENGEVEFHNNSKTQHQSQLGQNQVNLNKEQQNSDISVQSNENYNVFIEVREEGGDTVSTPKDNLNISNDEHIESNNNEYYRNNYYMSDSKCNCENNEIDNKEEYLKHFNNINNNCNKTEKKGCITVVVKLGSKDGVELKGAKVNLYMLNGVSPKLCDTQLTNSEGKVNFENLEDGCYRVISIVDRRYFEKPCYINWNEVIIDQNLKEATVTVVNRIKACCCKK